MVVNALVPFYIEQDGLEFNYIWIEIKPWGIHLQGRCLDSNRIDLVTPREIDFPRLALSELEQMLEARGFALVHKGGFNPVHLETRIYERLKGGKAW